MHETRMIPGISDDMENIMNLTHQGAMILQNHTPHEGKFRGR